MVIVAAIVAPYALVGAIACISPVKLLLKITTRGLSSLIPCDCT